MGSRGPEFARFEVACECGSGKAFGECCGADEACPCGSGKAYGECCGADEADEEEEEEP